MPEQIQIQDTDAFQRLRDIIQSGACVLFLGAGVSIDSDAPSGKQLAKELSSAYFPSEPESEDLGQVCEAIDVAAGRRDLNEWLFQRFRNLTPRGALLSIPTYHWKAIYTMNFDTLLEDAYGLVGGRRQDLRPFYSGKDPLSRLRPGEVPLYKLHGCLSRANSIEGRLVLTPDDFLTVGESRQRFLSRLLEDMTDYTIFYVGFGRSDNDFRKVLLDVERAADNLTDLRRSFALQPNFHASRQAVWENKRVTLIDATAGPFFQSLDAALPAWARFAAEEPSPSSGASSFASRYPAVSAATVNDVERNYEIIDERIRAQTPNTEEFFSGAQPNWGLIASRADARRDLEDEIVSAVLQDHHLDRGNVQCVLIHAEAGSGKTTLLRRVGVDLSLHWEQVVVSVKPFGSLEFLSLERITAATKKRVYLLVDDATGSARELSELLASARRAKAKLTVIANARTNEWREVREDYGLDGVEEFELRSLSRPEIDGIIKTLTDHNALGYLNGATDEAKVAAFERGANKQLLVALREATVGKNFDAIIEDEFDNIPSDEGRRAYLLVASLHRFGILTRAGLLHRALNIPLKDIGYRVLSPTTKIIVVERSLGESDVYYTTRHPLIADIVVDRKLISDRRRREFYEDLIKHLDLGYSSDLDAYHKLTRSRNRKLLRDFKSAEDRRDIMKLLLQRDPNDAFALQHAAMMEIDEHNIAGAGRYLEKAISLAPQEPAIRDTEGRFVLMSAIQETNPFLADEKFARAEEIFSRNAERRPDEPYAYKHLAETYIRWSEKQAHDDERMKYVSLAYAALNRGLSRCSSVSMLLQLQADIEQNILRNVDSARRIFARILDQRPGDLVSRFLAATLEEREGCWEDALAVLKGGLSETPHDPQLHFRIARLLAENDAGSDVQIRGHFDAAMLGSVRDVRPRLAYAAYLFGVRDYEAASRRFAEIDRLNLSKRERSDVEVFKFAGLRDRLEGRVSRLAYSAGWVELALGATEIYFNPLSLRAPVRSKLAVGERLAFDIGFNLRGPIAVNVAVVEALRSSEDASNIQLELL